MKNRDVLTLMEQVIAVLVFAVAAAICLRVFVFADGLSKTAESEDRSGVLAQNAAEMYKQVSGDAERMMEYEGWKMEDGVLYREDNGLEVRILEKESAYPGMGKAEISVRDGENERICFDLSYLKENTDHAE